MSYEHDRHAKEQDATEAMIRMRQPVMKKPQVTYDEYMELKLRHSLLKKAYDVLVEEVESLVRHGEFAADALNKAAKCLKGTTYE